MAKKTSKQWNGCPIRYAATVLGDPWSLLILRGMVFHSAQHYADLLNAGENISTNILADRLVSLENEGVIRKSPDPENGTRFVYRLTEKGKDLIPPLLAIMKWSEKWDDQTEVSRQFAADLNTDIEGLANRTRADLPN